MVISYLRKDEHDAAPPAIGTRGNVVVALAVIARACARTRAGSAVVALAWLAPTLALAQTAAGEDVVITAGEAGLVLLFGGSFGHAVALGLGVSSDRSTPVT